MDSPAKATCESFLLLRNPQGVIKAMHVALAVNHNRLPPSWLTSLWRYSARSLPTTA